MKRLIALTMVAGLMSFGAFAGQSNKPMTKTSAPPAVAASTTTASQPATAAEHGHVKKEKKHTTKNKTKEGATPTASPKN